MSSMLMDQWYIFKMSLNRNACETRLCIYQWTKMWPNICRNLTVFPLRTVVQYLLICSSHQLYRPWLLQIVKSVCICICLGKRLAENRTTCINSYEWLLLSFSSVQSLSHVRLFATPWIAARQAFLSITISWSSLKLTSIELVMPSSHLILCRPLFLLPPIPPSIRVFYNESTLRMRWPKFWSFTFSIIPSKEHPGLISFWMDWLDLLAVPGTLKSLLQYHSSKASILQRSAFFTVQLSHPYMTTGKTIALTRQTFVSKVMSLLFNMLSRLVITFLLYWVLTTCVIWWYVYFTYSFWKLKFPLSKHSLSPRYYPSKCS